MTHKRKYLRLHYSILLAFACMLVSSSFVQLKQPGDFLKQLGIGEAEATNKISQGILTGYINTSSLSAAKKIPLADHPAVVTSAISYARKYTQSDVLKIAYENLRQQKKPSLPDLPVSPDSLRQTLITNAVKSVESAEASLKNATGEMKQLMEDLVKAAKQTLEEAKSPGNAYLQMYTDNYPTLLEKARESHATLIENWEKQYPPKVDDFIKTRLEQFIRETENIDFNAQTEERNGKLFFTDPAYEKKSKHWKLAFRTGAPAIKAARKSVQMWIDDLSNE